LDESAWRRFGLERTRWVALRQARPILRRLRLRYRDDVRGSKQTGVLLLNFSPERIGFLPDTFFRHQLPRHRRQYVVIVIESLQALICELAFHGE
jgi:hypothetical protein